MKIVSIDADRAIAETAGVKREIGLHLVNDVKVGEYVIVHAGFAIEKIDAETAEETIQLMLKYNVSTM